ncbi:MAG TPA: response regulator transcription factor [Chloroflexi bacterium]|nr:response regulator transcription factor [Chloroflexota bacterium]
MGSAHAPDRETIDMMIDVIIIDDHPVVRAGIRTVLDRTPDVTVVAEGTTGAEALRLTEQHQPDVLVLDVNLPDVSGMDVTRQLRERDTTTAILVLTAHDDNQTVFGLLENGATGYVLKDEALETLADAVRAAARGETWLSPAVARQVVRRAVGLTDPQSPKHPSTQDPLTPRETEVLRLLAQGLDNAAIAERLVVTRRTVQNHVSNIYGKLGMNSRTEAALWAIRHRLIQIPTDHDTLDAS